MTKSLLLTQALLEAPIGVFVVSSEGILIEMNEVALGWFSVGLSYGDVIKSKLTNISDQPLEILEGSEGSFKFGQFVYRYVCGIICDQENNIFFNVCLFDDTANYLRLSNAEDIVKMTTKGQESLRNTPSSLPISHSFTEFEQKCCIDACLGFREDPNSTMVKYSLTAVVLECNKPLRGFSPEEIIGLHTYDHIHPDDIATAAAYHISMLEDPNPIVPIYIWLRKKHKNGAYVHTEIIGAYHSDEKGEQFICCVERVMNDERMEKMLSSVTDQIPCGVIGVEKRTGIIDLLNPNAVDWLKLERGQRFESRLGSLRSDVFANEECDKLLRVVKECNLNLGTRNAEITVKTLQGRVLTFLCSCKTQEEKENEQGQQQRDRNLSSPSSSSESETNKPGVLLSDLRDDGLHIWIVNDVTALSNAMEAKQDAILRFMRCTSHDMRTPMQAISLAAHSLSPTVSEAAKADINTIISSSAVLETIMSNILEFKTISSMKLVPNFAAVDVIENLNCIVNMLKFSTLVKEDVVLTVSGWSDGQWVSIDSHMFDRMVLNLMTNALKFTTTGSVQVICSINKRISNPDDMVDEKDEGEFPMLLKLQVIDTGCGMTEAAQQHLGELDFFSGEAGGFGLGTFIVKTYVQALCGQLHVKSALDVGTEMTLEIPTKLVPPNKSQGVESNNVYGDDVKRLKQQRHVQNAHMKMGMRSNEHNENPNKKSKTSNGIVLVVEDIHVNRKLIVKSLERGGFQVEQAENGAIGLKKMLQNDYQTVFMDINMPVMNGDIAVREYWKQCGSERKIYPKIIMLTGNITDADREMALACGAHEFMTKPVVPKQLWDAAASSASPPLAPQLDYSTSTSPST